MYHICVKIIRLVSDASKLRLTTNKSPFHYAVVLTKTDKLSSKEQKHLLQDKFREISASWRNASGLLSAEDEASSGQGQEVSL